MLALFRRFLETWPARLFFIILIVAFGTWGIADVLRNVGSDTAAARVGGVAIEVPQVQQAFDRQLARVQQLSGSHGQVPPALRREVLMQTVQQLVTQQALIQEVHREGLAAPDDAVRKATFAMPAFKGTDGTFDRARFDSLLQNNGLTEQAFVKLVREDLETQQLLGTVIAGVTAPNLLARRVYAFQHEARVASVVALPFAAAAAPPAPSAADLHRFYANNKAQFSAPEYRRIRAVILSPDTIARDITVSDADARAYYDQHRDQFVTPEKRSVQVLVASTQAEAQALADQWRGGTTWASLQDAAAKAGASAVSLDDTPASDFPDTALAHAVFAAQPDAITGPNKAGLGWQVFRVGKITPGTNASFASVKAQITAAVAHQKAADQLDDRVSKLQDAVSAVSSLSDLPAGLGVAAVEGTLDAEGDTPAGAPAPIPASPDLRKALIAAAFKAHKGDPPNLVQGPGGAWYAVEVEQVTPTTPKPYEQVAAQVRAGWEAQQRRHEQEVIAARLLSAVQAGGTLATAAAAEGLQAKDTPHIRRGGPLPPGVSRELAQAVFATPQGKATMANDATGFYVAVTSTIITPDPSADPAGLGATQDALSRSVAGDVEASYVAAIRVRAHPTINQAVLDTIVQP